MFRTNALFGAIFSLLIAVSAPANAEATADDFVKLLDRGDQTAAQLLHAYAEGIRWHDVYDAEDRKVGPSICPPPDLSITEMQDFSILKNYVAKNSKMGHLPVGAVLVYALVDRFPCEHPSTSAELPTDRSPEAEKDIQVQSLITSYKDCVRRSAKELATSRAEAEVVARGAVEKCEGARRAIFQHVTASDGLNLAMELDELLTTQGRSIAELAVVEARRK